MAAEAPTTGSRQHTATRSFWTCARAPPCWGPQLCIQACLGAALGSVSWRKPPPKAVVTLGSAARRPPGGRGTRWDPLGRGEGQAAHSSWGPAWFSLGSWDPVFSAACPWASRHDQASSAHHRAEPLCISRLPPALSCRLAPAAALPRDCTLGSRARWETCSCSVGTGEGVCS